MFAVARPTAPQSGDPPAAGRLYEAVPVRYSCWLYDPTGPAGRPEKLFDAACGHAGFVAAGLAVGWHPDGTRLDFVDRASATKYRVYAFDLAARRVETVPVPAAEHVAIGPRRGGGPRSADLAGAGSDGGLWVEGPPGGPWWRVPDSAADGMDLKDLGRRPAWSRDGRKVAFVVGSALRVCDTAARRTETWFQTEGRPAADWTHPPHLSHELHWHPDGDRVGLVDGSRLGLVGPGGWLGDLTEAAVVSFAGWDWGGRRTAYVTAEPLPYDAEFPRPPAAGDGAAVALPALTAGWWATLCVPNPAARSAVWVADADGGRPRKVVSGVRATFPHWSAADSKLSVWLTVEPPYRLTTGDAVGMRAGDPAALIDADTGALTWMPVTGSEHAQIGHVELRRGRVDAALTRFAEAAASLPATATADWMFFRAVALRQAGREADSAAAWRRFEPPAPGPREEALVQLLPAPGVRVPRGDVFRPKHRFAAEAFLSLEMAGEGIEFFRREFAAAGSDRDRLSASLALCQLLLLADRRAEYADHAAGELIPLAARALPPAGPDREAAAGAIAVALLPLAVPEFLVPLPDRVVRQVCDRVGAAADGEDDIGFVTRSVLRATARRLGDVALAERAAARLAAHPTRGRWGLPAGGEIDVECLLRVRVTFLLPSLLRE